MKKKWYDFIYYHPSNISKEKPSIQHKQTPEEFYAGLPKPTIAPPKVVSDKTQIIINVMGVYL